MYMPKETGGDFAPCPAGTHAAICIQVIDLGTQETSFEGNIDHKRQIRIAWELPDERMSDGRPFTIGKTYTFSSHKKAGLRLHLESWRGQAFKETDLSGAEGAFDIKNILGKACLLNVMQKEGAKGLYATVTGVSKLPKGMAVPTATNGQVYFTLDKFDLHTFNALGDYWREQIAKSPEYLLATAPAKPSGAPAPKTAAQQTIDELNDDIPF